MTNDKIKSQLVDLHFGTAVSTTEARDALVDLFIAYLSTQNIPPEARAMIQEVKAHDRMRELVIPT